MLGFKMMKDIVEDCEHPIDFSDISPNCWCQEVICMRIVYRSGIKAMIDITAIKCNRDKFQFNQSLVNITCSESVPNNQVCDNVLITVYIQDNTSYFGRSEDQLQILSR